MVRGYERYYQKASRSTRDPRLDGAWSPSLDMDALGLRAKWWRGPYEGPDGNNPSAPFRGADAPFQPPQEAIKLGNTTYADRVAAWAYSYDCSLFEQAFSIIFRNDTGLDFPGVGRTCNHHHLLAHMAKECKAGRCPKMKVAGAPVDSMLVALGIPCAPEWGANEDDDNFESLYAMHFLTAVVSVGSGACSSSASTATPSSRRGARRPSVPRHARRASTSCDPRRRSPRSHRRRRIAARVASTASKPRDADGAAREFFAGGPYRWYVAAVGAYFYCQLAVNFVVFADLRRHPLQAPQHLGRQPRRLHGCGSNLARLNRRRGGGRELRVRKRDEPRVRRGCPVFAPAAVGEEGGRLSGPHGLARRFRVAPSLPVVAFSFLFKRSKRDNEGETG